MGVPDRDCEEDSLRGLRIFCMVCCIMASIFLAAAAYSAENPYAAMPEDNTIVFEGEWQGW